MKTTHPILSKPIEHVLTSEEFLEMCRLNNFRTLNEVVEYPTYELLKKPGFGKRMLKELITILEAYQLETIIKDWN